MTTLAIHSLVRPEPRSPIAVRVATERDLPFIDALQKKHGKAVAFASHKELRSYIEQGQTAVIAQDHAGKPIGYCLFRDRYMKREDCGIIVQLVVAAEKHRGLVGAEMIRSVFERVPYGVRLFCCWCAQDLEANHFWEALGFVPLACRAGSRGKEHGGRRKETRVQIFWQRRIREGDEYPYWYPSQTSGGRLSEARIVLPIPPGKHWSEEMPLVVPGMEKVNTPALPEAKRERPAKPKLRGPAVKPSSISMGGLRFAPGTKPAPAPAAAKAEKPKREKQKNDPKLVAAAREFRDRYLDEVNTGRMLPAANGKYDVSRQLAVAPTAEPVALLNAA